MKLNLVVLTPGAQEGKALEVKLTQFVIGRDPQCQLRPSSPLISKRHCAILQRNGKVFVRDFDSTNGTFINEKPLKGEVEVKNDDKLKVGPLFAIKIDAPAPVAKPKLAPSPVPAAARKPVGVPAKGNADDDDIAAMLLALSEEDGTAALSTSSLNEQASGSTEMDILIPPGALPPEPSPTGDKSNDTLKEAPAAPKPSGNTATAAKSILEKMMKRPRN